MSHLFFLLFCLAASLAIAGCGNHGLAMLKPPKIVNPNEHKIEDVSDDLAKGADALGASGAAGRFKATFTNEDIQDIESKIVWAPMDRNEKFDLGAKGKQSSKYETWTKDYRKAIAEARQTGKPLLIWFSDSKASVISNRLSDELFSRGDFDTWVRKKFATLLVDKAIDTAVSDSERVIRLKKYYAKMTKRFSVKGTPEVLVVDVNGEEHARYRGYSKGEADFYWGRLKIAHQNAAQAYGSWREKMEKKGYRMWHSIGSKDKVFARMLATKGEKVALVTPEGKRHVEDIARFSQIDQVWINQNRREEE